MGQNLRVLIPMNLGQGVSSNTSAVTFNRTKRNINPGDYDGETFLMLVRAKNTDTVDRQAHIVNAAGTVQTSITIPANTTSWTTIETSSGWTPAAGDNLYRVKLDGTNSANQLDCREVYAVVDQINATKTALPFLLMNRSDGSSNVDDVQIYASTSTSYSCHEPIYCRYFKKLADVHGDTISGWVFEAVVRATNAPSNGAWGKIRNETDSADVTGSEWSMYTSGINNVRVSFGDGATNFHDGDQFRIWWRSSSGLSSCRMYGALLWVKITDLTKCEVEWPICRYDVNHGAKAFNTPYDALPYQPSKFTLASVYYQDATYAESAATGQAFLRKLDAGTDVLARDVPEDGDGYYRSAALALESGEHYEHGLDWDSGGTFEDLQTPLAVLVYAVGAPQIVANVPEVLELGLSSDGVVGGLVPVTTVDVPAEDFSGWEASPEGGLFGVQSPDPAAGAGTVADFAGSESVAASLVKALGGGGIQESMAWSAAVSAKKGAVFSSRPIVLAEFWLDSGMEGQAADWVRTPTKFYEARVTSFGSIDRSLPTPAGLPEIGDARIELAEPPATVDGLKFRRLMSASTPIRRIIILKIGPEGGDLDLFQTAWKGRIDFAEFPDASTLVYATDQTLEFYDEDLPTLLKRPAFEMTDDQTEGFSPIVYGRAVDPNGRGLIKLVRISEFDYNVARQDLSDSTITLFERDPTDSAPDSAGAERWIQITSGYTVLTETKEVDGVERVFTHVRFASAPDPGAVIRADVDRPERSPARIIRDYLMTFAGRAESDLAGWQFDELATRLETLGYNCDGAFDQQLSHRAALKELTQSFNLDLTVTARQLISLDLANQDDPTRPVFGDLELILAGSVRQTLARPSANILKYKYEKLHADGKWNADLTLRLDTDIAALLGKEVVYPIELPWCREAATADAVVTDYSSYLDLAATRIEFQVPAPRTVGDLELGKLIGVTHAMALDPSGVFTNQAFKITGLTLDLDRLVYTVRAIRRNYPRATRGLLQGFWARNSIAGPWPGPATGIFYAVFQPAWTSNKLRIYRTADYGKTWTWEELSFANNLASWSIPPPAIHTASRSLLPIVTQESSTGRVAVIEYDTTSNTWTETEIHALIADDSGETASGFRVAIGIRGNGELVIGAGWIQSAGGKDQFKTWRKSSTGWVDIGVTGLSSHARLERILPGADNTVHIFFKAWTGAFHHQYHQTLSANNVLGTGIRWLAGNSLYYAAGQNVGLAATKELEDGDVSLLIPIKAWGGEARFSQFSSRSMEDPYPTKVLFSGAFVFQAGVSATGNADYPAFSMTFIDNDKHGMAACFWGSWVVWKKNLIPSPTGAGTMAYQASGKVAYPISEPQMANYLAMKFGAKVYLAGLFSYPQAGGGATVGWEFVPVSDLPFDPSYTMADFAALARS